MAADAMAGPPAAVTVPHMWDRIDQDWSTWSSDTAERQRAVEQFVDEGDLETLAKQHSDTDAAAFWSLQPLRFTRAGRKAEKVLALEQHGKTAQTDIANTTAEILTSIGTLIDEVKAEDYAESARKLEQQRKTEVDKVSKTSDKLGEIADPAKSKSRKEVLESKHGKEAVAKMNAADKDAAFAGIRSERIVERAKVTYAAATTLVEEGGCTFWNSILSAEGEAEKLEGQSRPASMSKDEIQEVLQCLLQTLVAGNQKLAGCKARKLEVSRLLDVKRAAVKDALDKLRAAEAELQDAKIEHEVLRLQIGSLEAHIQETGQELKAAQKVSQGAIDACDQWSLRAHEAANEIIEGVASAVKRVAVHTVKHMKEVTTNTTLAIEWLTIGLDEKSAEMAKHQSDKDARERKIEDLKGQMSAPQPDEDISVVQNQLAEQKEELSECQGRVDSCAQEQQQIQAVLDKAKTQHRRMKDLARFGLECETEQTKHEAMKLATDACQRFQLWVKGKSRVTRGSWDDGVGGGAVQTLPPDAKELFDPFNTDFMRQFMHQVKADFLVRNGKPGPQSERGSEAGESWVRDFAGFTASATEHFAIGSDPGEPVPPGAEATSSECSEGRS